MSFHVPYQWRVRTGELGTDDAHADVPERPKRGYLGSTVDGGFDDRDEPADVPEPATPEERHQWHQGWQEGWAARDAKAGAEQPKRSIFDPGEFEPRGPVNDLPAV